MMSDMRFPALMASTVIAGALAAGCASAGSGSGSAPAGDLGVAWSKQFGEGGLVGTTADGSVIAGFGNAQETSATIERIDPSGAVLWQLPGVSLGTAVGVASDGSEYFMAQPGESAGMLAGLPYTCESAGCVAAAKLSPSGAPVWSSAYAPAELSAPGTIARIYGLGGATDGRFGAWGVLAVDPSSPGSKAFVASFSPAGDVQWSRPLGAGPSGGVTPNAAAMGPSGDIVVSGAITGALDFGDGPIAPPPGTPAPNIFVAHLGPTGEVLFVRYLGYEVYDIPNVTAVADASGNVFVTGTFTGTYDLGAGPSGQLAASQTFVAKLGPTGDLAWNRVVDITAETESFLVAAADPKGDVWLCGVASRADFAGRSLSKPQGTFAVLLHYDAEGNPVAMSHYDGKIDVGCSGLAFGAQGAPVISGFMSSDLVLGQNTLSGDLGTSFILQLLP